MSNLVPLSTHQATATGTVVICAKRCKYTNSHASGNLKSKNGKCNSMQRVTQRAKQRCALRTLAGKCGCIVGIAGSRARVCMNPRAMCRELLKTRSLCISVSLSLCLTLSLFLFLPLSLSCVCCACVVRALCGRYARCARVVGASCAR